mgnify:CR=1 FL=1
MNEIGLLIIATNKYKEFVEPLIKSADKFFMKKKLFSQNKVSYFIFTEESLKIDSPRDIHYIPTSHEPWPWMTLGRYKIFNEHSEKLSAMSYLYYTDVDMRFAGHVDEEILSDRVATIHPGFLGGKGTPEMNPNSLACVFPNEAMTYFAGGFNGGTSNEYLKMCKTLSANIDKDYKNDIIAVWHDESHMNRYFIDNPPTKVLEPSYCYPESWSLPYEKKLLALDKNHEEIRK